MSMVRSHLEELASGRSNFADNFHGGKISIGTGARAILYPTGDVSADVAIEPGASLDVVIFVGTAMATKICLNFSLADGSHLKCLILAENCENLAIKMATNLDGENSNSSLRNFFFGENSSKQVFAVSQTHTAKNSTSSVLCQTVLDDFAASEFYGSINIGEGAENSDAQQRNGNILLSDGATAVSSPDLNILNNGVRCAHGATVGAIDGEAMFYMASRGISPQECRGLIVEGVLSALINS